MDEQIMDEQLKDIDWAPEKLTPERGFTSWSDSPIVNEYQLRGMENLSRRFDEAIQKKAKE